MNTHRAPSPNSWRPNRTQIIGIALLVGLLVGGGTAYAVTAAGEPAQCTGSVPALGEDGRTTLDVRCTFPAPIVTVPGPTVTVPGPTVTVPVPGPTFTTTITVTPSPPASTTPAPTTPPATTPPTTPTSSPWPTVPPPAGATGPLTVRNGDLRITTANTVIQNMDIRGCVTIVAPGVRISNSRIACGGDAIDARSTGTVLENLTIDCLKTGGTAVQARGFSATGVEVIWCENAFSIDGPAKVTGSYAHDFFETDAGPSVPEAQRYGHTDGFQIWPGTSDVTVEGNWIDNRTPHATSGIIMDNTGMVRIVVRGNRIITRGYGIYCPIGGSQNQIVNNRISAVGPYGPWVYCTDEAVVSGNVLT